MTMDMRLVEFIERHDASRDPCVAEALLAINVGSVAFRGISEGVSSRELAQTYAIRSSIAENQGRQSVAAVMRNLSEACRANEGNPCSIWMLEGTDLSFVIYELMPSKIVAGCIRFNGSLGAERDGP
jgi:hypothetical protein